MEITAGRLLYSLHISACEYARGVLSKLFLTFPGVEGSFFISRDWFNIMFACIPEEEFGMF